jgi:hypothetical protein
MQNQAICLLTKKRDNAITVEYKVGRQTKTVTIAQGDEDYNIAASLKSGDKFIIEIRDTKLVPSKLIEIEPKTCPLPYIIKKLETR